MRYELRPVRPDDVETLFTLHRDAMRDYVESAYGPWDDAVQRGFLHRWLDGDSDPLIIEVDGEVVGVLDYVNHDDSHDDSVYIGRIEIDPTMQGRGLGTAVLSDVIADADRSGEDVTLEVIDVNPARRLYERLGFLETATVGRKVHLRRPASRQDLEPPGSR
ncbi:MAG TPA: GNAT family N-acetyltransferase [Mycobacteriales bacterium]|nr:GNAT family N-acetyltransferase [Mycobacteriales bacterium]